MNRLPWAAALLASAVCSQVAHADTTLTLDQALERLRASPAGRSFQLQVDEARAARSGARRLLSDNPSLGASAGPRFGPDRERRTLDASVELSQPLDRPGERGARIAGAEATAQAGEAEARSALLQAEGEVALAFFQTLAASRRERLAADAESGARRSVQALERRHELRDVALLDVNVGRGALARATAQLRAARADRLAGEGKLRALLSLDAAEPLALSGDLREHRRFTIGALLDRAGERADVRASLAAARLAEAEAAAARSARWPRLSLGAGYEREEGADVARVLVGVELPFFDRGQAGRASAQTRARRLRLESDFRKAAASARVRGAHAAFQERVGAARELEQALPLLAQNEELARKSYEAGQISLAAWLLVRREGLETQVEHLAQLLAAAEAGVELALAAGVSP